MATSVRGVFGLSVVRSTRPSGGVPLQPLVRLRTVLIIAAVLVVALVLLFPGRKYLQSHSSRNYNTASVSYLRTLLKVQSHDDRLRIVLAHKLIARGALADAGQVLTGLMQPHKMPAELARLHLEMAQFSALGTNEPGRLAARQRVREAMTALQQQSSRALTNADIEHAATDALAFGLPGVAAQWYQVLSKRQPEQAYHWWALAGKWWLAANRPDRASRAWRKAMQHASSTAQRNHAASEALAAAGKQGGAASVQMAKKVLARDPDNSALLSAATDIALAANKPHLAFDWVRRLAVLRPHDDAAQRKLGQVALANNDLDVALKTYQGLSKRHPDDAQVQRHLAQLYEWTAQPARALPYYRELAQAHPSAALDKKLVALGLAAHDYPVVVAAMLRQNQRQRLAVPAMTRIVGYMNDQLGEPKRTINLLEHWLTRAPADRPLWRRLAIIHARTNQRQRAIQTWQRNMTVYGASLTGVMAVATLQTEAWHFDAALKTLSSLRGHGQTAPTEPAYWRAMGNLAWQQNDMPKVALAYGWLFKHRQNQLTQGKTTRLATAWMSLHKPVKAVNVVVKTWPRQHDATLLLSVLGKLLDNGRTDLADKLLAVAGKRPQAFQHKPNYWILRSRLALQHGNEAAARAYVLIALRIAPHNSAARVTLLSILLNQHDNKPLARYLALWRDDVKDNPALWQVYALGYSALGDPRRALPWFARRAEARPKDYLWLLAYADALDRARRFDDAYRLRRYALTQLRPSLLRRAGHVETPTQRSQDYRVLAVQQGWLGGTANLAWLRRVLATRDVNKLKPVDLELLIDWHLSANEPAYARFWLLRARMRRLRMPAYQQLSVALAHNDTAAIAKILAQGNALGVADRVRGLQRTHQNARALLLALNHINPQEPWSPGIDSLPRAAAELYQTMPQYADVGVRGTRLDNLDLATEYADLVRSSENWTLTGRARTTQLAPRGGSAAMANSHERAVQIGATHRGDRTTTSLTLGHVDVSDGGDFNQFTLDTGYQWTARLHSDVFWNYHQQTLDSGRFRQLGTRSAWGFSLDYAPTDRNGLSLTAQHLRYQSRWGGSLGTGYQLDGNVSHALEMGQTYAISAYLNASYVNNNLAGILPAQVAARLPVGAGANALLSDYFGFAGVGLIVARGQPGSAYPLVGELRYNVNLGLGYVWPDHRLGLHLNGAVGRSILGSDELSLFLRFDQTGTQNRGNALTVGLRYRYFFGK